MGICISKDNSDVLVRRDISGEANENEGCTGSNSDIELFKQPPPSEEDCPICFIQLPTKRSTGSRYQACCGKVICSGCFYTMGKTNMRKLCPFCRTPEPISNEEIIKRLKKRMEVDDSQATSMLGDYYHDGKYGLPQDYGKAFELWHRAAELGDAKAYHSIGYSYEFGDGVDKDEKKAMHYYEQAAMRGYAIAWHNLGANEQGKGNMERALKHYMIAVEIGDARTLENIRNLYSYGYTTKDDYAKSLGYYQMYLEEVKSDQRDEAAAAFKEYKYYE